jgi:hypothetical protein
MRHEPSSKGDGARIVAAGASARYEVTTGGCPGDAA